MRDTATDWVMVIVLTGDFDWLECERLGELVAGLSLEGVAAVEIDMSGVTFLGGRGVRALLDGARSVASRGASFRVAAASEPCRRVFDLTGTEWLLSEPGGPAQGPPTAIGSV
jgi:anti-sigma B factor antagonist